MLHTAVIFGEDTSHREQAWEFLLEACEDAGMRLPSGLAAVCLICSLPLKLLRPGFALLAGCLCGDSPRY